MGEYKLSLDMVAANQFEIIQVQLGTNHMPLTNKNKSGSGKVPVHFNVY